MEYKSEKDILDFINNLNEKEKIFFIEIINKTIEVEDNLQIFILTQLTKSYKNNQTLNYWEKSLFNNIKQISQDELFLFFNFLETLDKPIQNKVTYGLDKNTKDENIIVIKKLETIGIVNIQAGGHSEECINLAIPYDYSVAFNFYPYVNDLYTMIKNFKDIKNNKL